MVSEETQRDVKHYTNQLHDLRTNTNDLIDNLKQLHKTIKKEENIEVVPSLAETIDFLEKAEFLVSTSAKHYNTVFRTECESD